ncbi:MAG: hypothetical protein JWM19_5703 [Actinomycetia bacterium]|nr:hypothetical protein [Actinomycetes bacterium]
MITDGQLAARISRRLHAKPAGPQTPDIPAAPRRRPARQARTTAALTALPVAAATIATAALLPWAVARDTAYVASHLTHAPSAVPAGAILFSQSVNSANRAVTDRWDRTGQTRVEGFTQAGQLEYESGRTATRTTVTAVSVNYLHKTWSRSASPAHATAPAPSFTCASPDLNGDPVFFDPRLMAAWLRASVSCGTLKAGGTATVDGVTAIKLIRTPINTPDYKQPGTVTYFVNPTTYLPDRLTLASGANVTNLQWLSPTAANLAKLDLPVPPAAFTQAPG